MTHIMLDLETWGTEPGSHLRSIGALLFDPALGAIGDTFYVNVAPLPTYGLTTDYATVQWWAEQRYEARAALESHQKILPVALGRFSEWIRSNQPDPEAIRLWALGPTFDVILLDAAYRAISAPVPWHYRSPRDIRTIMEAAGMDPRRDIPDVGVAHNALDDCRAQAMAVIRAYRELRKDEMPETVAITALRREHERRVTELLNANNAEVMRRREAERRVEQSMTPVLHALRRAGHDAD